MQPTSDEILLTYFKMASVGSTAFSIDLILTKYLSSISSCSSKRSMGFVLSNRPLAADSSSLRYKNGFSSYAKMFVYISTQKNLKSHTKKTWIFSITSNKNLKQPTTIKKKLEN